MVNAPLRIQRRRTKGWRMPPNTVSVTRPGPWGNPFQAWRDYDGQWLVSFRSCHYEQPNKATANAAAARLFKAWVAGENVGYRNDRPPDVDIIKRLRGKNLACYCRLCPAHAAGKPFDIECPDCAPCHADVLGRLANRRMCE